MRRLWIGAAVAAVFAITAEGTALAQQTPTQPSIADPDQADQTTTAPAKPPRHTRKATASPAVQPDPDLDANDQLAPSQMKQPMPAAVAQPSGAVHPMKRAATDALRRRGACTRLGGAKADGAPGAQTVLQRTLAQSLASVLSARIRAISGSP